MALARLSINLMFVRCKAGARDQWWHRDQYPFLQLDGHAGSLSADLHTGFAILGEYGNGDPPAGIEYQPGIFTRAGPPMGEATYIPNASANGAAVMHTGDVVHRGTASAEERVAMYIGFTPVGINLTHQA